MDILGLNQWAKIEILADSRYSNTNLGGAYCQFALHGHGTKDKAALCFLTNRNNAAAKPDVLHRFCRFYGKS
jgi:hypothetical protein